MSKITLVAVFFNEGRKLPGYFKNVQGVADEITIVDCSSKDRTAEICRKNGALVIPSKYRYFEQNINKALSKVKKGDWALILDADERLSDELKREIRQAILRKDADVFFMKRINYLFDGFSTKSSINTWLPRLFRKGAVRYEHGIPHEPPKIYGRGARLPSLFFHYAYPGVQEYVKKMEEYLFQMPIEYAKTGRNKVRSSERDRRISRLFGDHGLRMMFLYPIVATINLLLRHRLILDGMRGIIYSICGGISVFLEEAAHYQQQSTAKRGIRIDWSREYPDR